MGGKEGKQKSTGLTPMLKGSRIANDTSPNESNKENIPPKTRSSMRTSTANRSLFGKSEGSRSRSGQRTPCPSQKTARRSVSPQKKTPLKRVASASGDKLRDEGSPSKKASPGRPKRNASVVANERIELCHAIGVSPTGKPSASSQKPVRRPGKAVLELDNVDVSKPRSPAKSKPAVGGWSRNKAWRKQTPDESEESSDEEEARSKAAAAAATPRRSKRTASTGRNERALEESPSKALDFSSLSVRTPSKGRYETVKSPTRGTPGRTTVVREPPRERTPTRSFVAKEAMREHTPTRSTVSTEVPRERTPSRSTVPKEAPMERTPTRSTAAKAAATTYTPIAEVNLNLTIRLARTKTEGGENSWRKRSMNTPRTEGRPVRVATVARRQKDTSYEPDDVRMVESESEDGETTSESEGGEEEDEEPQRRTRKSVGRGGAAASRSASRARGAAARADKGRAAVGFKLEVEEDDDRVDLSKAPANLAAALDRLAVYRCPRGTLLCREEECMQISEFIRAAVAPTGISQACYISGVPGTGKTASVMAMLKEVAAARGCPKFVFIQVNAMCYSDPKQVFSEILYEYERQTSGAENVRRLSGTAARKRLNGLFECVDRHRPPVLMLVDELDQLSTKKQELIYDVFNWSSVEAARVSIISIANTLDLPERMLNQRICSRLGMNRIVFQPYTHEEIKQIVVSKLGGVTTNRGGARVEEGVIEATSIEMAARKVAAISGDLRKATDILRAAIKAAIKKGEKKLTFNQVKEAISDASETLLVRAVRTLDDHERIAFEAAVDIIRTRDVADFSMGELVEKYEAIARLVFHEEPLNYDALVRIVLRHCSTGLVKFVNPNERSMYQRRVRLLPAVHDAVSALKIVDQERAATVSHK